MILILFTAIYIVMHIQGKTYLEDEVSFTEGFIWGCLKNLMFLETNLQWIIMMFFP